MTFAITLFTSLVFVLGLAQAALADGPPFRIGVSVPLTGPVAEYGAAVVNGLEMARKNNPVKFKNIEFLHQDNRYDGKTTVSAFYKHRDIDKVALTFVWGDAPSLAVAPLAEASAVPMLAVLTDPVGVRNMKHVIRFLGSRFQYADALTDYLQKRNIRHIGLVHSESPYDTNSMLALKNNLKPNQTLTVLGSFVPTETDFRSVILRAKAQNFDILGVYLYPNQFRSFFRQSQVLRLNLPFFGADGFESNSTVVESEGAMEGAVYPLHAVDRKFHKRYTELFNNDTHITYAANAYEFANTMAFVRTKLGDTPPTTELILQALKNLPTRNGVLGAYSYHRTERDGQFFEFPVVMKQILGTQTVTID